MQSKLLLFTFILILLPALLVSQSDNTISAKNINIENADTTTLKIIKDSIYKYRNHHLDKRLEFSRLYLAAAKKTGLESAIGDAYYELGYSYEIIGQNDMAIEACHNALKYFEKLGNKRMLALTYNEIGLIYSSGYNEMEHLLAIKNFRKFLNIQKELQDTAEIAGAYSNIGLVFIYMGKLDSALYFSKKALKLRRKIKQKHTIPISLGNMGQIYLDLNKPDSAIKYLDEAREIHSELDNIYGLFEAYGGLINYYIMVEEFEKAKHAVDKRIELANKINSIHSRRLASLSKAIYFEKTNNFEKALENYKDYKTLSDSVRNSRIKNRVANLEAVYELDKKEKQLELFKEKERSRKQRFIFLVVVSILSISFFAFISITVSRKRKSERQLHEMEKQNHLKEKKLAESELEKSKLKESELNTELEYKSKQLTSHALNMMKTNQFINELEKDIKEIRKESDDSLKPKLKRLLSLIKTNNKSKKDWDLFKKYFEEVNQGFYDRLHKLNPNLSSNDYKLSALIKLNMNIKESADVLNISPESVKTARYRLRKKLDLKHDDDLYEFMQKL